MPFRQPLLRALLLFAGPVFVLLLAFLRLGVTTDVSESAQRWDRMAKRQPWDVVVLGASFARTDVDRAALAAGLGARQDMALVLIATGSSAPVWYAILKERVYGNGLSPKFVVIPATVWTLLTNRLPPAEMREVLEQMPVPDEVVTRRSLDPRLPAALQRFSQRRADLRDPLLQGFRNLLPRLLFGVDPSGVEAAGTAVFGEHHGSAGARAIPAVESGGEIGPASDYLASDPGDSYLADIAALVEGNGGRLVLILPPFLRLPRGAPDLGDSFDAPLRSWAREAGVTLLDYRGLGWDSSRYTDALHLRPDGARELTKSAVEAILNGGEVATPVTRVIRTGTPPSLPDAVERPGKDPCLVSITVRPYAFLGTKATEDRLWGLPSPIEVWEGDTRLSSPLKKGECTGTASHAQTIRASRLRAGGPPLELRWSDAVPAVGAGGWKVHWVYPGTSLTWTIEPADPSASTRIVAAVSLLGEGTGSPAVEAAGARREFTVSGGEGTVEFTVDRAPGEIAIHAPAGGAFLVVRELVVVSGQESRSLVDPPPARKLHLFDVGSLAGVGAPPSPPPMESRSRREEHWFAVPWDSTTPCSPLRVRGPGGLLPARATARAGVARGTWHVRNRLEFQPEPGSDPATDYSVVFDPDRGCRRLCKSCGDRTWVYPGDTIAVVVPPEPRRAVAEAFARLRVSTWIDGALPGDSALRVLVKLGASLVVERRLQSGELNGSAEIPFPAPVGAVEDLTVELLSEGDLPATLVLATLEDR